MCIACEMAYWMAVDDEPPPPKKKAAPAFDCDVPPTPRVALAKPRKPAAKKRSGSARSKSASIDRE